jgi:uncharacterized protein (TIGR03435 family)
MRDFQISGAQGRFAAERFDIAAKPPGPVAEDELRAMLQTLPAERFRLAVRFWPERDVGLHPEACR